MPVGTATRAQHTHRAHGVAALGLLTAASLGLSVLGIGTGNGPLGPPTSYGMGISRDVGDEFTEGATMLRNDGWFTAHVEGIRPVPVDDAAARMPVTAVEIAPSSDLGIGMSEGPGYDTLAREVRSPVRGYAIPPQRLVGERASLAEVLVRAKITEPGVSTYRGYEVTYRSGFVRHRMVVDVELQGCTPRGATCPASR